MCPCRSVCCECSQQSLHLDGVTEAEGCHRRGPCSCAYINCVSVCPQVLFKRQRLRLGSCRLPPDRVAHHITRCVRGGKISLRMNAKDPFDCIICCMRLLPL
ncbi:Hypothetical protein, putative [Bodo saltans]|uniref:Uncharacterized protein n=1 Tax=Bodo saltans TaxID=75058 RepID=A0A0S4IWL2_BODSA|nr:Hypothetical protein, putative [Bodo saltans]|eukprot:CUG06372.1 Hypothetical protein, putative [Bodo saltans]